MAYNDQYRNAQGYGQPGGRGPAPQGNRNSRPYTPPAQPRTIEAKPIPAEYVDEAERVIAGLKEEDGGKLRITTSKMRNFLTLVTDIYNKESLRTEESLSPDSQLKLMRLRVRIVYDAGRDDNPNPARDEGVKRFVEKAKLLEYIKGIGSSRAEMIRFAHYMEALVAYHRFMGGKEN